MIETKQDIQFYVSDEEHAARSRNVFPIWLCVAVSLLFAAFIVGAALMATQMHVPNY